LPMTAAPYSATSESSAGLFMAFSSEVASLEAISVPDEESWFLCCQKPLY